MLQKLRFSKFFLALLLLASPVLAQQTPISGGSGGDATAANQTTAIGHLSNIASATQDGADTQYGIISELQGVKSEVTDVESQLVTLNSTVSGTLDVDGSTVICDAGSGNFSTIAGLSTSTIFSGTTAITPKFAAIDVASSGDNTLVAAVTGKKIRVLSAFVVCAGAVTARFESGASGTALTGQMTIAEGGGFVLPFNPLGWFESASGALLNLELSGAVSCDGSLVYVEV